MNGIPAQHNAVNEVVLQSNFNREKQIFKMNPGQDLYYHTGTHYSDIL